jgi:hypothetical protein
MVATPSSPSLVPESSPRARSLPVLSNAEKRCFQSCKRKHYIRYRLLKRPLQAPESLLFAGALRRGLDAWWRAAMSGEDRLAAALAAVRAPAGHGGAEALDAFDLAKADALLVGYHARWSAVVVEVLAVGVEFTAAIMNPDTGKESRTYALGGRIGAIARLAGGLVYVVDHKTTSESIEEGSEYWQRLRLDAQVSDYIVGARSLGYEVSGCYFDVVAKPRLSPLEATPPEKRQYTKKDGRLYAGQREADETPEEYRARLDASIAEHSERYFARMVAPRVEEDETEAALDTWNTARDIREADLALRHPRNPDACKGWGQMCEFFAVCTRDADVHDPALFRTEAR